MEIVGLEQRHTDLARGIVIARGAVPLAAAQQRALWERLQTAGITEASEDTEDDPEKLGDFERQELQQLQARWQIVQPVAEQLMNREHVAAVLRGGIRPRQKILRPLRLIS